jgi:hypothetical protein
MAGHSGRELGIRVPELAAYETAKAELLDRVSKRLLPDESPEMTYGRLCVYAKRLGEVLSGFGSNEVPRYSRETVTRLSPNGLLERTLEWLQVPAPRPVGEDDLATTLIAWIPQAKQFGILLAAEPASEDPYDPTQNRSGGGLVHGAPLLFLVRKARAQGFADLPLHPLALLPESTDDPVLSLPPHSFRLDRRQAELYVTRHELGELSAVRYVVESAFAGIAGRLDTYASLPRRISVVMTADDRPGLGNWGLRGRIERHASADEVRFVDDIGEDWAWTFSSSLSSYQGIVHGVYQTLRRDLEVILGGERAIGREDLA